MSVAASSRKKSSTSLARLLNSPSGEEQGPQAEEPHTPTPIDPASDNDDDNSPGDPPTGGPIGHWVWRDRNSTEEDGEMSGSEATAPGAQTAASYDLPNIGFPPDNHDPADADSEMQLVADTNVEAADSGEAVSLGGTADDIGGVGDTRT